MELYEEFFKIIKQFNKKRINYAVIGGIAMSYYSEPRYTKDIDILTLPTELEKIKSIVSALGYDEAAPPWKFNKTKIDIHRFAKIEKERVLPLDILCGESEFHKKIVINAIKLKSDDGNVRIAGKNDLIKLKAIRNSDQDKIDIKKLRPEYYEKNKQNR